MVGNGEIKVTYIRHDVHCVGCIRLPDFWERGFCTKCHLLDVRKFCDKCSPLGEQNKIKK